jgi:hypothetical protein
MDTRRPYSSRQFLGDVSISTVLAVIGIYGYSLFASCTEKPKQKLRERKESAAPLHKRADAQFQQTK